MSKSLIYRTSVANAKGLLSRVLPGIQQKDREFVKLSLIDSLDNEFFAAAMDSEDTEVIDEAFSDEYLNELSTFANTLWP